MSSLGVEADYLNLEGQHEFFRTFWCSSSKICYARLGDVVWIPVQFQSPPSLLINGGGIYLPLCSLMEEAVISLSAHPFEPRNLLVQGLREGLQKPERHPTGIEDCVRIHVPQRQDRGWQGCVLCWCKLVSHSHLFARHNCSFNSAP